MFCPNCGTKIPDGAKFCPNCGSEVDSRDTQKPADVQVADEPQVQTTAKLGAQQAGASSRTTQTQQAAQKSAISSTDDNTQNTRQHKGLSRAPKIAICVAAAVVIVIGVEVALHGRGEPGADDGASQEAAVASSSAEDQAASTSGSEGVDPDNPVIENSYVKAQKDKIHKAAENEVSIQNFKYSFDKTSKQWLFTGKIVNDSKYAYPYVAYKIVAHGEKTSTDKYDESTTESFDTPIDYAEVSGVGLGPSPVIEAPNYQPANKDKEADYTNGIGFFDIAAGESRAFSFKVAGFDNANFDESGDIKTTDGMTGDDLTEKVSSFSLKYQGTFAPMSDWYDFSKSGIKLEKNVILDPAFSTSMQTFTQMTGEQVFFNKMTYSADHDQLGVTLSDIQIDSDGTAKVTGTITNNTGFYLNDASITVKLFKSDALPGTMNGYALATSTGDGSLMDFVNSGNTTTSGGALAPGKGGSFESDLNFTYTSSGTEYENTFDTESFKLTDSDGKQLAAGTYTTKQLEDLGYKLLVTDASYEIDIDKSVEKGCLPERWSDWMDYCAENGITG